MLWLSRRPEWQRSREFETTTSSSNQGSWGYRETDNSFTDEDDGDDPDAAPGKTRTRVVFQPTADTTHTIFYRGHWLRVRRGRKSNGYEMLSIRYVTRRTVSRHPHDPVRPAPSAWHLLTQHVGSVPPAAWWPGTTRS